MHAISHSLKTAYDPKLQPHHTYYLDNSAPNKLVQYPTASSLYAAINKANRLHSFADTALSGLHRSDAKL